MDFEWDEAKNQANIRKHRLSFSEAHHIFDAPMLVEIDNREDYGERRFIGMGFLRNLVVVIVFTELQTETIRIISLRKALKYERERFEQAIRNRLDEA